MSSPLHRILSQRRQIEKHRARGLLPFGSGHAGLNEAIHGRVSGTVSKIGDQRMRLARLTPGVNIPRVPQPGWNLGTIRNRASGQGFA